jgi:hypothetical protein
MDAAAKYHRLALYSLQLAEATGRPATQDAIIRMAKRWAQLADQIENRTDEAHRDRAA